MYREREKDILHMCYKTMLCVVQNIKEIWK